MSTNNSTYIEFIQIKEKNQKSAVAKHLTLNGGEIVTKQNLLCLSISCIGIEYTLIYPVVIQMSTCLISKIKSQKFCMCRNCCNVCVLIWLERSNMK